MDYFDAIDDETKEKIFQKQAKKAYAEVVKNQLIDILDYSIKNQTCDEKLLRLVNEKNAIKKNHKPKEYLDPYHVVGTTKHRFPGVTQAEVKNIVSYVQSAMSLGWIKNATWSFELTQDGFIHFHSWLVPSKPIAPANVKDRLKRSKLKYCIDFKKSHKFLQIYRRSRQIDEKNTLSYITKNESKDVHFRKLFSLQNIYKCHSDEDMDVDPSVELDAEETLSTISQTMSEQEAPQYTTVNTVDSGEKLDVSQLALLEELLRLND